MSSSAESSEVDTSSEEEASSSENEDIVAQFAQRLRAQHFDPLAIFTAFDPHGSDVISTQDFRHRLARLDASSAGGTGNRAVGGLFRSQDKDHSGQLDRDEVARAIADVGQTLTSKELDVAMAAMDKNGDGMVDFDEFITYFHTSGRFAFSSGSGLSSMGNDLVRKLSRDGNVITKNDFIEQVVRGNTTRPGLLQHLWNRAETKDTPTRRSRGGGSSGDGTGMGESRRRLSPDNGGRRHGGDKKYKSRLSSTPRTQLGRELQAERRQRQRELLQSMKVKRQQREEALMAAQHAKEQRLADLAKHALAGRHAPRDLPPRDDDDGDTTTSDDDEDAALAAKYLNAGGTSAPPAPVRPKSQRDDVSDDANKVSRKQPTAADLGSPRAEAERAASDAVKAAKESHAARLIINREKTGHSNAEIVVGRGHLLGANIDAIMLELREADVLSSLGDDELLKLAGTCARICVPRGEAIMAQGDVCHGDGASMFIVVEGLLTAWIESTPGGIEIDVGTLGAGDVFGEQSLLLGKPRGATIVTGTECVLLQITKQEIAPLLRLMPTLTVSLAQILVERTVQNEQRTDATNGRGENSTSQQLGGHMVRDICKSYGIALARVRMEDSGYSDDEDDNFSDLLTSTRRTGNASHASAGRAARHAAQLDNETSQIREARDQYMAALAAADGKRLEQAYKSGTGDSELAPVEQERRRRTLARYEDKLNAVEKAKRTAVYELHRQLSAASLTSTGTGSGAKWVAAQSRVDSRISTHSIDEVFDVVSRQKSSTALLRRGRFRSASAPRLRPPPVPSESAFHQLESSRSAGGVLSRLSRSSYSERPGGASSELARNSGSGGRTRRASVSGVSTLLRSSFDGVRTGGLSGGVAAANEAWEGME